MNAAQRLLLLSGRSASLASRAAAIVSAAGGVLFNPSDLSTMTVGRDGTGGAPSSGSVVGRIYDKAGSGRYAAAPSDAARPLLTVSGGLAYLTTDGVDDWMNLSPAMTIGTQWWHVGGWRSDTTGRAAFSATNGNIAHANHNSTTSWRWAIDTTATLTTIATGNPTAVHVLTVEKASNSSLSGRYNGGGAATIDPYDDNGNGGFALFSQWNNAWGIGLAGRFYGGAWALGTLTSAERATLEQYAASLSGVTL